MTVFRDVKLCTLLDCMEVSKEHTASNLQGMYPEDEDCMSLSNVCHIPEDSNLQQKLIGIHIHIHIHI
jgi:hypothetical protein